MATGIFAAMLWALETVTSGLALDADFIKTIQKGVFLAPFVCTFFHDAVSAIYLWIYAITRRKTKELWLVFKSSDFKWLVIASAIGGPVGMTGYMIAVNYMGASVGAIASAVYPAIGSILAYFFLKQKLKGYQWFFLAVTLLGVFGISYSGNIDMTHFRLGIFGAFMCAFGWGTEGVILSKCMKNDDVKSEYALLVRQSTSAVIYGLILLPILRGYDLAVLFFKPENSSVLLTIACAALFATASYFFYYKTIAKKGVAKAMALNITYTAWAVLFSVILFRNLSLINLSTLACGAIIVICSILSATDIKNLIKSDNNK